MAWNRLSEYGRLAGADSAHDGPRRPAERSDWSFFAPLHFEPNYAYPLVVWLAAPHVPPLAEAMSRISLQNYVGVSTSAADPRRAGAAVAAAVSAARRRFPLHPKRVFLVGAFAGGTAAISAGLASPESFAGVASLCGGLPRLGAPLARLKQARTTPLLLCASRGGEHYGDQQACDDLRLLHAAGMHATLRQYPGAEEPHAQAFSDLNEWIMAQVTTPAHEAAASEA